MSSLNQSTKIKLSINRYIEFTSVLMVFLQGFVITGLAPFDLKFYYFFLITNSILLLALGGIKIHKYIVFVLFLISLHGILAFTLYSIPIILFIKQIIGITITVVYFYNIFSRYRLERLFSIYLKLALITCVIGILFYPTGLLDGEPDRLDGLMSEPSKFVVVLIPALFYFIKKKKYLFAAILLLGFILAKSSLGIIAIILMILILVLRTKTLKYVGITLISIVVIFSILMKEEQFQERVDSTLENLNVFETKSFPHGVNISSYALLKNAYITFNNFKDHPLGTGLGSYGYQHDIYLKDLNLPEFIHILGLEDLNKDDANSMFLRITSDFGLFGLIAIFGFLWLGIYAKIRNYDSEKKAICLGMFIYFLIKFIRMGHYFPEEMYFFLFMFLYTLPKTKIKNSLKLDTGS